jgi:hypothetical protein
MAKSIAYFADMHCFGLTTEKRYERITYPDDVHQDVTKRRQKWLQDEKK